MMRFLFIAAALVAACATGCGGTRIKEGAVLATGVVTVRGVAATGLHLSFAPAEAPERLLAVGNSEAGGAFSLRPAHGPDGFVTDRLEAGTYRVAVEHLGDASVFPPDHHALATTPLRVEFVPGQPITLAIP